MTLAPAFHQSTMTVAHPYYGFYVSILGTDRLIYQYFATAYAAKHFVNLMIADRPFKWMKSDTIEIETEQSTLRVRGTTIAGVNALEDALEHEFTDEEEDFTFPNDLGRMYRAFSKGRPTVGLNEEQVDKDGSIDDRTQAKPAKEPKAPKEPRPSKEGLVTVQQIAEDNKWDAKHVRAALRKAKIEKPAVGWAFPPSEVKAITKLIKDNIK